MSKSYQKKKDYRLSMKKEAKRGMINDPSGRFINKSGKNSMERDYYPQR